MLLTVENKLKTSRHQVHGKPRAQGVVKVLTLGGEGAVTRNLAWPSRTVGQSEHDGSHRPDVSRWVSLAGASRAQLAVLTEAGITAGLREGVTGVTRLASVRPLLPRLKVAPIVLAVGQASHALPSLPMERGVEAVVDEGGIYSW